MRIYLTNSCKYNIILIIDDNQHILLQPFETKKIIYNGSVNIKFVIKRDCESIKKSSMYHLVVETEYLLSDIPEEATFTITREKIQFSLNAYYDRLFLLTPNAKYISETHKIISEDKIKKAFNKSRFTDFAFESIILSPGLIAILILIGILLTLIWGWKFAIVYFPLALLFVGILNWLTKKFWDVIGKKAFKMDDDKTEFYKYFSNDFISKYYSNISRVPFMGKVDID